MTPTALKEAAQVGVPRDKIMGNLVLCSEQSMVPAGEASIGFICATFLGMGTHFPLIQEIQQYVYAQGKGPGPAGDVGTARWNLGVLEGVLTDWMAPDQALVRPLVEVSAAKYAQEKGITPQDCP